MEELSLDNILDVEDLQLFGVDDTTQENDSSETENSTDTNEETTEVEEGPLFESESVGSEDTYEETEDNTTSNSGKNSPDNLYSSLASVLKEEGVFPDLLDEDASSIKSAEDFVSIMEKQVQAKLEEKYRRIDSALNANVEVSELKKYQNVVDYLDSITEKHISDESEQGENLRKQLIYQDYINGGFSKERAEREVKKSLDAGTDIEDAKEALLSNKKYFEEKYDNFVNEAKVEQQKLVDARKKETEDLKNSILNDDKVFGELDVDKKTRQKVFDNLSKPIYKDPSTGDYLTALQKYERENKIDFLKNLSLVFTLTDGFKNMDNLVKGKVNKEVKKSISSLEKLVNNSTRNVGGELKFVTSIKDDPNSYIGKGWGLDI
jgi:hypothetical protein